MIAVMALVLLSAVALLLLRPEGIACATLRDAARRHPRTTSGAAVVLAVCIAIGGLWPAPDDRETEADGYAEVWHMVEAAPQMRDAARASLADGRLTSAELADLRALYRRSPDVDTMRRGVIEELSR